MPFRKPPFLSSVRFKTRQAARESGSFKAFELAGERPIVVKGPKGISAEERKMRKQFPKAFSKKEDPFPFQFRVVKLGKKKKGIISRIFKKKRKTIKKRTKKLTKRRTQKKKRKR